MTKKFFYIKAQNFKQTQGRGIKKVTYNLRETLKIRAGHQTVFSKRCLTKPRNKTLKFSRPLTSNIVAFTNNKRFLIQPRQKLCMPLNVLK